MLRWCRLLVVLLTAAGMLACSLSAHSASGQAPVVVPPPPAPGVLERMQARIDELERRVARLEARP